MNESGLFNWLGSANVQKMVGLVGGPTAGDTLTGLPMWVRAGLAIGGPVFAALIHAIDAWRAQIAAKPVIAAVSADPSIAAKVANGAAH